MKNKILFFFIIATFIPLYHGCTRPFQPHECDLVDQFFKNSTAFPPQNSDGYPEMLKNFWRCFWLIIIKEPIHFL